MESSETVQATPLTAPAGMMPNWQVGDLPSPPRHTFRDWTALLGPGILIAGSSVGAGEWLFGPAVTAQFGGTYLWLATLSIVTQVFYNLEVMRYALYCGEPVFVGYFRTAPGPRFWTGMYLFLFIAHIWPFMASNAAVPLAAALLGHLPGSGSVHVLGVEMSEPMFVKMLGYVVFVVTLLPLIFGGKIYTMLERVMTFKIIVVLVYLVTLCTLFVTFADVREIATGFLRFGEVALRAETVVSGPHFSVTAPDDAGSFTMLGSVEKGEPVITAFIARQSGRSTRFNNNDAIPEAFRPMHEQLAKRVRELAGRNRFFVQKKLENGTLTMEGSLDEHRDWILERVDIEEPGTPLQSYTSAAVPAPLAETVRDIVANQGFERVTLWSYWNRHHKLPPQDWGLLAAFAAIAGAGGLSNCLFSNYCRDKGWGMGAKTGAIPSAIGGRTIALTHVGMVFPINAETLPKWRGWFQHILRDQLAVWMICSFIGLALPCMLSLEFIRNAPISDNRVAAMTAEGIASRFPNYARFWWFISLFTGFLVLAPNAVMSGDLIARLWTDIIWTGSASTKGMKGNHVKYVYYSILFGYFVWGLFALTVLNPLQIAKIGAVLGNIALGFSSWHTLYVNRTLLPPEIRPNWFMQAGLVFCGIFFIGITVLVLFSG